MFLSWSRGSVVAIVSGILINGWSARPPGWHERQRSVALGVLREWFSPWQSAQEPWPIPSAAASVETTAMTARTLKIKGKYLLLLLITAPSNQDGTARISRSDPSAACSVYPPCHGHRGK